MYSTALAMNAIGNYSALKIGPITLSRKVIDPLSAAKSLYGSRLETRYVKVAFREKKKNKIYTGALE